MLSTMEPLTLANDKISTMDPLPQGEHGIYRVLVDGEVVKIAVDGPHEE